MFKQTLPGRITFALIGIIFFCSGLVLYSIIFITPSFEKNHQLPAEMMITNIEYFMSISKSGKQAKISAKTAQAPFGASIIECNTVECLLDADQNKPDTIHASHAIINQSESTIHAEDNVTGHFNGYTIKTDSADFNFKKQYIVVPTKLHVHGPHSNINASKARIDLKNQKIDLIHPIMIFYS